MKLLYASVVAVILALVGNLTSARAAVTVDILPTTQDAVVIESAALIETDSVQPVLDLKMRLRSGVQGYRLRTVMFNAAGKAIGGHTILVSDSQPSAKTILPAVLVVPGATIKVAVTAVDTPGGNWRAHEESLIDQIKVGSDPLASGTWGPPLATAGKCEAGSCDGERAACISLCGDFCVSEYHCDRGSDCSFTCVCRKSCSAN